jgi:uncharacterized membrane protein YqjE
MGTETAPIPGEEEERSWSDRLSAVAATLQALLQTRAAIFGEELRIKAILASKGLIAAGLAAALGTGVLLLFAALLVAVLTHLLGSLALGILAVLLLYVAGAAVAASLAWKALSRVEPFEFPATRDELRSDWESVRSAFDAGEAQEPTPAPPEGNGPDVDDLEARLRAGAR